MRDKNNLTILTEEAGEADEDVQENLEKEELSFV